MKTLRELAARALLTQRRFQRVYGRQQHEFALEQAQYSQYAFFCEHSKQTDAQAVLRVHNEARAELLDELERDLQLSEDANFGTQSDSLGEALEIIRRYRGKT